MNNDSWKINRFVSEENDIIGNLDYDINPYFNLSNYSSSLGNKLNLLKDNFIGEYVTEHTLDVFLIILKSILNDDIYNGFISDYCFYLYNSELIIDVRFSRIHEVDTLRYVLNLSGFLPIGIDQDDLENKFNYSFTPEYLTSVSGNETRVVYLDHDIGTLQMDGGFGVGLQGVRTGYAYTEMRQTELNRLYEVYSEPKLDETKEDTYEKIKKAVENIGKDKK